MDADRFDELAKNLGLSAARRGIVAGLLGGGVTSLLGALASDARRRASRHDELAAEKRKKRKKKKHKKRKKKTPGDEAPPCTEDSCPIPPGCSEQTLEDCATALFESWMADAEPCRPACEDPDSASCRECVEPIVASRLPEFETCAAESCSSAARASARAHHRANSSHQPTPYGWWQRKCDKPTCCSEDFNECSEDGRDATLACFAEAIIVTMVAGPAGLVNFLACAALGVYMAQHCQARYGCLNGLCLPGDSCCSSPDVPCLDQCCSAGSQCCSGGGCCNSDDVCCRTPRVGGEGGEHYCCEGSLGLTCKESGPHSHTCQVGSGG